MKISYILLWDRVVDLCDGEWRLTKRSFLNAADFFLYLYCLSESGGKSGSIFKFTSPAAAHCDLSLMVAAHTSHLPWPIHLLLESLTFILSINLMTSVGNKPILQRPYPTAQGSQMICCHHPGTRDSRILLDVLYPRPLVQTLLAAIMLWLFSVMPCFSGHYGEAAALEHHITGG